VLFISSLLVSWKGSRQYVEEQDCKDLMLGWRGLAESSVTFDQ
jgi:hypothetical protein